MAVASFPDLTVAIEDTLVGGDRVALMLRMSATNTGAYRRGAATGGGPSGQRPSWNSSTAPRSTPKPCSNEGSARCLPA
jgi:SnoaL-like polyketide cyclase